MVVPLFNQIFFFYWSVEDRPVSPNLEMIPDSTPSVVDSMLSFTDCRRLLYLPCAAQGVKSLGCPTRKDASLRHTFLFLVERDGYGVVQS